MSCLLSLPGRDLWVPEHGRESKPLSSATRGPGPGIPDVYLSQMDSDVVKASLDDTGSAAAEGRQANYGLHLAAVLFTHQGPWAVPSGLIAVL